jgi:hypothetical protein
MIPEAFNAIAHHLAPSVAGKLLQYRQANPSAIIKLDILPIKDYVDPWNLSRIPMPSPRQQAAEQNITHAAPPTAHWTTPSSRLLWMTWSAGHCESHLSQSTCCNLEAFASNSGSGWRLSHANMRISLRVFKT